MIELIALIIPFGWFPQDWRDQFVIEHEGRQIVDMMAFFDPDRIIPAGNAYLWCYDRPGTDPLVIVLRGSETLSAKGFVIPARLPTRADIAACGGTVTGEARLTWTTPTQHTDGRVIQNLTGYQVQYGQTGFTRTVTVIGNEYTVTGLEPGEWQFRVRALGDGETGQATEAVKKDITE